MIPALVPFRRLAAALLLLPASLAAQTPAAPPPAADSAQDPATRARAEEALERAVRALGGRRAILGARGLDVSLAGTARSGWQQARVATDTAPRIRIDEQRWAVDPERRRVVRQSNTVSPGEIRFLLRTVADTAGQFTVDLLRWRTGTDVSRAPAATARATVLAGERVLPHLAVRQALGRVATLRWEGESERDGRRLHAVSWADEAGQRITLLTDAGSGLPVAAVAASAPNARSEYADFRRVGGIQVPHRLGAVVDGRRQNDLRVVRLSLRPVPDSLFAVPAGYADPPAAGEPRAVALGGGVFRLDGMPNGYHAAFVVSDSAVDVLEAPQSPQWTEAALRVIRATAPGRPIRRVFITHHHADHVGGLGPYVAEGATLVAGPGVAEAVRRQLPDSLRERARFATVADARSFGSGAGRIDAFVVPNTHAEGNLAVHVPGAGVLFQGDLFYIPERGDVPPAFEVAEALDRVLAARGIRPAQIVGVHGRTGTW